MVMTPQITPYHRYRVRESRYLFGISGGTPHRRFLRLQQVRRHERDYRVESEQSGCRARYRFLRPLALRLHAEVRSHFFKRHFECPPL